MSHPNPLIASMIERGVEKLTITHIRDTRVRQGPGNPCKIVSRALMMSPYRETRYTITVDEVYLNDPRLIRTLTHVYLIGIPKVLYVDVKVAEELLPLSHLNGVVSLDASVMKHQSRELFLKWVDSFPGEVKVKWVRRPIAESIRDEAYLGRKFLVPSQFSPKQGRCFLTDSIGKLPKSDMATLKEILS